MKSRTKLIAFVIALLASALFISARQMATPGPGRFSGYVSIGFEKHEFTPDNSTVKWWFSGGDKALVDALKIEKGELSSEAKAHIVFDGVLSSLGSHGHLGHYWREVEIRKIIEIRTVRKGRSNQAL
jgi:hypothetical protein